MAKSATAATNVGKSKAVRIAPVVTSVSTAVPVPEFSSNRGSKTNYPFADLITVGMSFGVKNKTAKDLGSIVANQNRKDGPVRKDAAGNVVYRVNEIKDSNGAVIGSTPTTDPVRDPAPYFRAADCNPKNDPDGASVRVFRVDRPSD